MGPSNSGLLVVSNSEPCVFRPEAYRIEGTSHRLVPAGVDVTRQINTTVKSAAGTFVKAAANTGSATVSTAIKGTTANSINNFKQSVTE